MILLLSGTVSCGPDKPAIPAEVLAVDTLIARNPRTALYRISLLEERYMSAPDAVRMHLALKKIKARDKAYIFHVSDDTIRILTDYYDAHGTLAERMETYYYRGSVYRDLRDYPRALESFHNVVDLAASSKENVNDEMLFLAYSQLSGIYELQNKHRESLDAMCRSYEIAQRLGEADLVTRSDMATAYRINEETDSAYYFFKQVLDEILHENSYKEHVSYIATQLSFYEEFGDRFKSERDTCLSLLRRLPQKDLTKYACTALRVSYERLGCLDSAIYFEKLALSDFLSDNDFSSSRPAARNLYRLYKKKGDLAGSYAYAEVAIACSDSLETGRHLKESEYKDCYFKYRRDAELERSLQSSNSASSLTAFVCVLVSFFLAIASAFGFFVFRRRMRRLSENFRNLCAEKKGLEERLLHESIQQAMDDHDLSLLCDKLRRMVARGRDLPVSQTFLRNQFWSVVDAVFPEFHSHLFRSCSPLRPENLHVAYLIKAGLRQTEVAQLLGMSPSSVSKRVKRLEDQAGCSISLI